MLFFIAFQGCYKEVVSPRCFPFPQCTYACSSQQLGDKRELYKASHHPLDDRACEEFILPPSFNSPCLTVALRAFVSMILKLVR